MATQETTPGSQTEESNALDLPSAYDIRDYVLQRPSQHTNSEAFSSEEACSIPCSSDVDPGFEIAQLEFHHLLMFPKAHLTSHSRMSGSRQQ
ncbi:shieldin complex subunit 1 isoform X4 [Bos mutus]|uniref:shieldin complex subunit 1 isoform X4 n=1 Tax=Bos mutus TaxID=72004 RepID=UPI0038B6A7C6